ncbi:unnamed protein product [Blepharisma stoltei]|uniref:Uncharacterized protein n=1 Tax=Blepharisma stoltei TaxID=1481888 RepID=A0AAU9IW98_9CILI|nr:unnamed protein product [Blepharisma stoltei]
MCQCKFKWIWVGNLGEVWIDFRDIPNTIGDLTNQKSLYWIGSDTSGTLVFTFIDANSNRDSNDFSVDVPLHSWTFLVLYWVGSTFNIYMPGHQAISKTAKPGFTFFAPAGGQIILGRGLKAYYYEMIGFKSATINAATDVIALSDGSTADYAATGTCSVNCADTYCHPVKQCLGSLSSCNSCDTSSCLRCETGYFLHANAGLAACLSCAESCSSCTTSPECFECAEIIVKEGSTCSLYSIGFQISFAAPNIKIDFASPLTATLTRSSFVVKANDGSTISTSGWTLNSCTVGATSCIILTDNVNESMLPIEAELDFA